MRAHLGAPVAAVDAMPTACALEIHSHSPSEATISTWRSRAAGLAGAPAEEQYEAEPTGALEMPPGEGWAAAGEGSGSTVTSGLEVTPTVEATAGFGGERWGESGGSRVGQLTRCRWER